MFEVDRLGLMHALREDAWHLVLTLIHLHYTTGLLSEDGEMQNGLPNLLDLDQPMPSKVDFKATKELVAPTTMGIPEKHAQATRDAARRVLEFHRNELNALAGDR